MERHTYDLDTMNLRTAVWAQLEHIGCVLHEIGHGRVRSVPRVIVLERADRHYFFKRIIIC